MSNSGAIVLYATPRVGGRLIVRDAEIDHQSKVVRLRYPIEQIKHRVQIEPRFGGKVNVWFILENFVGNARGVHYAFNEVQPDENGWYAFAAERDASVYCHVREHPPSGEDWVIRGWFVLSGSGGDRKLNPGGRFVRFELGDSVTKGHVGLLGPRPEIEASVNQGVMFAVDKPREIWVPEGTHTVRVRRPGSAIRDLPVSSVGPTIVIR